MRRPSVGLAARSGRFRPAPDHPRPAPRARRQAAKQLVLREQLGRVGHRLEFERIAGGIEQEHRRLLARLAFEADRRRDHEFDAGRSSRSASAFHSSIGSTSPKCGTGTSSPSTGLVARAAAPPRARDARRSDGRGDRNRPNGRRFGLPGSRAARRRSGARRRDRRPGKARWKGGRLMPPILLRAQPRCPDFRSNRLRLAPRSMTAGDSACCGPCYAFIAGAVSAFAFAAGRLVAADARRLRGPVRAARAARRPCGSALLIGWAVRPRPVRRRAQLDRDRLHLPGGDAGMARLGRGGAPVALPRRLSGARQPASPGGSGATIRWRWCSRSPAPGRSPNGCAAAMFTGFPWNPVGGARRHPAARRSAR